MDMSTSIMLLYITLDISQLKYFFYDIQTGKQMERGNRRLDGTCRDTEEVS